MAPCRRETEGERATRIAERAAALQRCQQRNGAAENRRRRAQARATESQTLRAERSGAGRQVLHENMAARNIAPTPARNVTPVTASQVQKRPRRKKALNLTAHERAAIAGLPGAPSQVGLAAKGMKIEDFVNSRDDIKIGLFGVNPEENIILRGDPPVDRYDSRAHLPKPVKKDAYVWKPEDGFWAAFVQQPPLARRNRAPVAYTGPKRKRVESVDVDATGPPSKKVHNLPGADQAGAKQKRTKPVDDDDAISERPSKKVPTLLDEDHAASPDAQRSSIEVAAAPAEIESNERAPEPPAAPSSPGTEGRTESRGTKRGAEDAADSDKPAKRAKPAVPHSRRTEGKGVAQKVKRTAKPQTHHDADLDAATSSSDSRRSFVNGTEKPVVSPITELRGLVNHSQACFSNVALQLLNAAFGVEHVAKLLKNGEVLQMFGLDYDDCLRLDSEASGGEKPDKKEKRTQQKILKKLRDDIAESAKGGDVSVAAYVGQLINDLRTGLTEVSRLGRTDKFATPLLAQQVFAYSSAARNGMNGDTQEDAHEYFLVLLDVIIAEHPFVRHLFEIQEEEVISCTAEGCTHTITKPENPSRCLTVHVPAVSELRKGQKGCSLTGVLRALKDQKTNEALSGYVCDGCKRKDTSTKTTTFSRMPENLVLLVDRVQRDDDKKITTKMQLDAEVPYKLGGSFYELRAVVRHHGNTTSGHYTIDQELDGQWFHIDDKNKKTISSPSDRRGGLSAMLLFKRVDDPSQASSTSA